MNFKTTEKFTGKSDDYVKYRPTYPQAALEAISERCPLVPGAMIADVGAGTGIFSKLLLERGCTVISIEPNDDMRSAADQYLQGMAGSLVLPGTGEATGLVSASCDLAAVAQAFHWMDPVKTKTEFLRILKPGGYTVLIWNERDITTPFGADYEKALAVCPGHRKHEHNYEVTMETIEAFYGGPFDMLTFPNQQSLDLEAVKGRLQSTSYAPTPNDPLFEPLMADLDRIFEQHQSDDAVTFDYTTRLYIGPLSGD